MWLGMQQNPAISPEETLDRIIREKGNLPGYEIRGVGSDFDLLVRGNAEKFAEVQAEATLAGRTTVKRELKKLRA